MTALSDYLHAHLPEGWTAKDLSTALVNDMDKTTVYRYLNGKHTPSPPEAVLQAFARVLAAPIVELRRAAGVSAGEDEPWVPPMEANRLNYAQRSALNAFLRATAAAMDDAVKAAGADDQAGATSGLDPEMRAYIKQVRDLGQGELADQLEARFTRDASSDSSSSKSSNK